MLGVVGNWSSLDSGRFSGGKKKKKDALPENPALSIRFWYPAIRTTIVAVCLKEHTVLGGGEGGGVEMSPKTRVMEYHVNSTQFRVKFRIVCHPVAVGVVRI